MSNNVPKLTKRVVLAKIVARLGLPAEENSSLEKVCAILVGERAKAYQEALDIEMEACTTVADMTLRLLMCSVGECDSTMLVYRWAKKARDIEDAKGLEDGEYSVEYQAWMAACLNLIIYKETYECSRTKQR